MSYNCVQREEQDDEASDAQPEGNETQTEATHGQTEAAEGSGDIVNEDIRLNNDHPENKNPESRKEEMECDDRVQNLKRQHITDSDSDGAASVRCAKLKPAPNLPTRKREKKTAKTAEKPPSK